AAPGIDRAFLKCDHIVVRVPNRLSGKAYAEIRCGAGKIQKPVEINDRDAVTGPAFVIDISEARLLEAVDEGWPFRSWDLIELLPIGFGQAFAAAAAMRCDDQKAIGLQLIRKCPERLPHDVLWKVGDHRSHPDEIE